MLQVDAWTTPKDRTLQEIIIPMIVGNMRSLLQSDDFKILIANMPNLNHELLGYVKEAGSSNHGSANGSGLPVTRVTPPAVPRAVRTSLPAQTGRGAPRRSEPASWSEQHEALRAVLLG